MSYLSTQVWQPRPDAYHQHGAVTPLWPGQVGLSGLIVFLIHRHDLGDVDHGHTGVESGPNGPHATDVADVNPGEDLMMVDVGRYRPCDFARDLRGARRRQAEFEALL